MKLIEGFWSGEPCYVVGGGPSLREFDWALLRGGVVRSDHPLGVDVALPAKRNIIVVNRAWRDVPHADVFFTEDARGITELWGVTPEWKSFRGARVLQALNTEETKRALEIDPGLTVIPRRQDKVWAKTFADGMSMSSCSGVGALNVAYILGADPIYLLGFDCRADDRHRMSNYHDDYPESWQTSSSLADTFRSDFEHWAALHLKSRTVINLCDERFMSRISCWPKWDRDGFLKNGTPRWRELPSRGEMGRGR